MCELFGLSSRLPTRATFCLRKFAGHGALGHTSVDGWGVAFYDLQDVLMIKGSNASRASALVAAVDAMADTSKRGG